MTKWEWCFFKYWYSGDFEGFKIFSLIKFLYSKPFELWFGSWAFDFLVFKEEFVVLVVVVVVVEGLFETWLTALLVGLEVEGLGMLWGKVVGIRLSIV